MRYTREPEMKPPFAERHIIIETEEERVKFNQMIEDACINYAGSHAAGSDSMWKFVDRIRSGN